MPETSLLTSLKYNTRQTKSLRNHALDEYNATRKLMQSSVPITKDFTNESLTRPVSVATSEVTDSLPLESWLLHNTNVDSKERCHLWNLQDGLITLYMSKSKTLFFKQIPTSSIKEVRLLKNGTKLKVKLNNRLVLMVTSYYKSRSSCVLKLWFAKLDQTSYVGNESEDATVADKSTEQRNTEVFCNIQFAFDLGNGTSEDKEDLRNLIKKNGGQISYIFTKNTKYFVCGIQKDFYKSQRAAKLGIPIVSKGFIKQCVAKGKLIPAPRSDEDLRAAQDKFAKGKIYICQGEKTECSVKEFSIDTLKKYKMDDAECPNFPEEYHVVKFAFLTNKEMKSMVCVEAHIAADSLDHTDSLYRVMISISLCDEKIRRFFYFADDAFRLCKCYEAVVKSHEGEGCQRELDVMGLDNVADAPSEKLRNLLEEMKMSKGSLHRDVERLVASIWHDSLGELAKCDIVPEDVTIHDVSNGMITLLKIEQALRNNSDFRQLSKDFYKHIRRKKTQPIDSIQAVAKEREVCQILKDVVCMKENLWNAKNVPPCILQYSALNCVIRHVDRAHAEFKLVQDLFPPKNEIKYDIINVYRVSRSAEDVEFCADMRSRKLLFHSSSSGNIVSILSRGLIMPSKASDELGIPRTDEGYLGHGIYFSDSFTMSSKYTSVSASRGSRLMFIHEVALGDVYETDKRMPHLISPPTGFQSVKGSNLNEDLPGNEFVVYNVNQQRMRYLVEFTLDRENVHADPDISPLSIFKASRNLPAVEIPKYEEPVLKHVEFGLVNSKKNLVNLDEFHVRGKIVDLVAEVTVFQVYRNNFGATIEGKYVFPLEENVAVCGFEAYINEKHVIGVVKEKEQARKEYKKAVAEGHGAYLMEEEEPSIFSLSLGNIPAYAIVIIKIKYVCELETVSDPDSCVLFSLPKNLSNWKQDSALMDGSPTQAITDSMKIAQDAKKTSFMVSVDMPYDILEIKSPTHAISWKKTAAKACVKLARSASLLERNLRLFIRVAEIHVPRIWVEQNDEVSSSEVAMVTFFPEFDFKACDDYQCTVLLDMSCSMNGKLGSYAKFISKSIINALPEKSKFNVVMFGSYYKETFVTYEQASDSMKQKALEVVSHSQANLGGSDLIHVLGSLYLLLRGAEKYSLHNVCLISDGHLADEERVLRLASKISSVSSSQTRFFSYAVGDTPNSHFLRKICAISGGQFEHFLPSVKHTWAGQINNQMRCAKQPVLTDVRIEWCNYEAQNDDSSIFTNVPEKPKCLFSGSRMTAYSFLPNCSKATLHARILGAEVSTVVTVNSLSKITGKTLHYLAAKAVFKEYDTGNLADNIFVNEVYRQQQKSFITSLSIKHSVVCKFTSFIAVEKRDDSEDMSIASGPTMEDLLKSSFIDEIIEVPWEGVELSVQDKIDELLKRSGQNESSSILQARELAQDAAKLCEKLSDEPLKKLLVSTTCFRLGIDYCGLNSRQVLDRLLLKRRSPNFEIVNEISRCEDPSYSKALEELATLSWPSEDSVQLMSLPSSLRPVFISAFHCVFQDETSFVVDDIRTSFWSSMRGVDMKQEYIDIIKSVKLRSQILFQENRRRRRHGKPGIGIGALLRQSSRGAVSARVYSDGYILKGIPVRAGDLDDGLQLQCGNVNVGQASLTPHVTAQVPTYVSTRPCSRLWRSSRSQAPLPPPPQSTAVPPPPQSTSALSTAPPTNNLSQAPLPPPPAQHAAAFSAGRATKILNQPPSPSCLTSPASTRAPPPPAPCSAPPPPLSAPCSAPPPPPPPPSAAAPPPPPAPPSAIRAAPPMRENHLSFRRRSREPIRHAEFEDSSSPLMFLKCKSSYRADSPRRISRLGGVISKKSALLERSTASDNTIEPMSNFGKMDSALLDSSEHLKASPTAVAKDATKYSGLFSTRTETRLKKSIVTLEHDVGICPVDEPTSVSAIIKKIRGKGAARTSPSIIGPREDIVVDRAQASKSSPPSDSIKEVQTKFSPISCDVATFGSSTISHTQAQGSTRGGAGKPSYFQSGDYSPPQCQQSLRPVELENFQSYSLNLEAKKFDTESEKSSTTESDTDTSNELSESRSDHKKQILSNHQRPKFAKILTGGGIFGSAAKSCIQVDDDDMICHVSECAMSSNYGITRTEKSVLRASSASKSSRASQDSDEVQGYAEEIHKCYREFDMFCEDGITSTDKSVRRASSASKSSCASQDSDEVQGYAEEIDDCYCDISGFETYDDVETYYRCSSTADIDKVCLTPVARLAGELLENDFDVSDFEHIADLTQSSFSPDDVKLQGFSCNPTEYLIMTTIEQAVTEAGGKSLGLRCFHECMQLLLLSVMLILCEHIGKEVYHDGMNEVMEALKSRVKLSNEKYPSLYNRLELGTSWTNAALSIIDSVCKKLP